MMVSLLLCSISHHESCCCRANPTKTYTNTIGDAWCHEGNFKELFGDWGFFFLSLSILISDRCGATADAGMRAVRPIDAVDAVVASGWESVVIVATHPAASVHTRFK